MKVVCHFLCPLDPALEALLEKYGVSYKGFEMPDKREYASFDIPETSPAYAAFRQLRPDEPAPIRNAVFTERERENARWLTCTALTAKVELQKEEASFTCSEFFGEGMAHHRTWNGGPFYVSKPLSRRPNQHFFTACGAEDHLFCTERAKTLLEALNLPLAFQAVCHYKTGNPIGDLYDVQILTELPFDALELSNSEETYPCPVCGKQTFLPPLQLRLRGAYLEGMPMICATKPVFGWGGNYAARINLISHDLYLYLKKNELTRGLRVDPVELIG